MFHETITRYDIEMLDRFQNSSGQLLEQRHFFGNNLYLFNKR